MSDTVENKHFTDCDYIDDHTKEEWINGIRYMSPRPQYDHISIQGHIYIELSSYFKNSCRVINEPDTFLTKDNLEELRNDTNKLHILFKNKETNIVPDLVVVCDKKQIVSKGIIGIPNLIVEVLSPSNSSSDTIIKFNLYQKYGIPEYWIIDPMTKKVFIWVLEDEQYTLKIQCSFDDKFISPRFEGLEIDLSSVDLVETEE